MLQFIAPKRANVPAGLLSKEFLQQFKTEEDVSKHLKEFNHSQVLEQMLQGVIGDTIVSIEHKFKVQNYEEKAIFFSDNIVFHYVCTFTKYTDGCK